MTQVVSNTGTYAHFSWAHPGASASGDCVYAGNSYKYDYFTGDNSNATQRGLQTFFQTTGSRDLKKGWTAASCDGAYAYVCMFNPTTAFPCMPPPLPPPPPPAPPSPPSPPQPISCEWWLVNSALQLIIFLA